MGPAVWNLLVHVAALRLDEAQRRGAGAYVSSPEEMDKASSQMKNPINSVMRTDRGSDDLRWLISTRRDAQCL